MWHCSYTRECYGSKERTSEFDIKTIIAPNVMLWVHVCFLVCNRDKEFFVRLRPNDNFIKHLKSNGSFSFPITGTGCLNLLDLGSDMECGGV